MITGIIKAESGMYIDDEFDFQEGNQAHRFLYAKIIIVDECGYVCMFH